MSWLYKVVHQCRLCKGSKLEKLIDFGYVNLYTANTGNKVGVSDPNLHEKAPLNLLICLDCKNLQLAEVVNPNFLYKNFKYHTQVTFGLDEHFKVLANTINSILQLGVTDHILDIGSNDGTFLRNFLGRSKVLGIEPGVQIAKEANESGVKTLNRYFSSNLCAELLSDYGKFKVIFCANTIANIDDLDEIFNSVRKVLLKDGYFILETQNGVDVLNKFLLDTVYHEHLTYFTLPALQSYVDKMGMRIDYIKHHNQKGGSIQVWITHKVSKKFLQFKGSDINYLETEAKVLDDVENLKKIIFKKINRVKKYLEKNFKKKVVGFGASVGTNTLLNLFCKDLKISKIIDDKPAINFLPFNNELIEIQKSSEFFKSKNSEKYILVFSYRYFDKISKKYINEKAYNFFKIFNFKKL